jgi:protein O-mannosyl-transferase
MQPPRSTRNTYRLRAVRVTDPGIIVTLKGRLARPFFFSGTRMHNRLAVMPLLILLAVMLLAFAAYWPGLRGDFLFDDFVNLPALGATGPIDNWPAFWRYITSGTADPTGRPLTLLTFLLDARNWPAEPYSFKRTNLILHLFNGVLLYTLLTKLGRTLEFDARRYRTAALLGAALWLLHPLLVSTTLYIVQREAMLPATCVLAGLLAWLHGRSLLVAGKTARGFLWSMAGLAGFTVLGGMAKANGALLPILALSIEFVVLVPRQALPSGHAAYAHRTVLLLCGVIPALAIGTYLIWIAIHGILSDGHVEGRPWSISQRLITEPRVLMEYLSLLWFPRPFSSGLFNDQYIVSKGLLHPGSTLPAIVAVLGLIGLACWLRRSHPALALAILFYFAGQLLESSSLPLELYFEHRNYTPALLMFWPLGLWLVDTSTLQVPKRILMFALPLGLAVMTHARASVWGDVQTQALVWAQINPESARAQANAAQIEMQAGHPHNAAVRLEKLLVTKAEDPQIAFNLIGARCMTGGVRPDDIISAQTAMLNTPNAGALFTHWFDRTLPLAISGGCPGLAPQDLLALINAGLLNPRLTSIGTKQDLTFLRGRIALAQHRPDDALNDFEQAIDLQARPDLALEAAATLGNAGYPKQGLNLLDHYHQVPNNTTPASFGMPLLHEWVLSRQHYWTHELIHLRHQLSLDANVASIHNEPTRSTAN